MEQSVFINRIREALSKHGTAEEAEVLGRARRAPVKLDLTPEQKVERFTAEMALLNVKVERVPDWAQARQAVAAAMQTRGFKNIAVAGRDLEPNGTAWAAFGRAKGLTAVEQADAGVVQADYGIAETGSSVVLASPDKPRIAFLLPPVLYLALEISKILGSMPDLMAVLEGLNDKGILPATVNVITGPSRTADIELSLTVGVHGPGEVYLTLVG